MTYAWCFLLFPAIGCERTEALFLFYFILFIYYFGCGVTFKAVRILDQSSPIGPICHTRVVPQMNQQLGSHRTGKTGFVRCYVDQEVSGKLGYRFGVLHFHILYAKVIPFGNL